MLQAAIPIGLSLLGGILGHKSKNKQQDQQNRQQEAEFQRQQQIEDQRARSRAALLAGMLKGYGKGGGIGEEALFSIMRKNMAKPTPINTAGRNMGAIGGGLSGIAQMLMLGMNKSDPNTRANGATGMLSGDPSLMGSPAPSSGIFGDEGEE